MKSRRFVMTFIAFLASPLLLVGSGCGGDKDSKQPATPAPAAAPDASRTTPPADGDTATPGAPGMQRMMQTCPMMVEGVTMQATDTESGVAMVFTTSEGDVEDLRRRVRAMAEMYNTQHARGGFQWHRMGGQGMGMGRGGGAGPGHGMHGGAGGGMGPMPAAVAAVNDVEGGARLVLTPRDPAHLEPLRARVRMHVERMRANECPMLMPQQQ